MSMYQYANCGNMLICQFDRVSIPHGNLAYQHMVTFDTINWLLRILSRSEYRFSENNRKSFYTIFQVGDAFNTPYLAHSLS